jgi:hypothetical protein
MDLKAIVVGLRAAADAIGAYANNQPAQPTAQPAQPTAQPAQPATQVQSIINQEDLISKFRAFAGSAGPQQALEILKRHGVSRLTEAPQEKWALISQDIDAASSTASMV